MPRDFNGYEMIFLMKEKNGEEKVAKVQKPKS